MTKLYIQSTMWCQDSKSERQIKEIAGLKVGHSWPTYAWQHHDAWLTLECSTVTVYPQCNTKGTSPQLFSLSLFYSFCMFFYIILFIPLLHARSCPSYDPTSLVLTDECFIATTGDCRVCRRGKRRTTLCG